jgi:hypothetical protein
MLEKWRVYTGFRGASSFSVFSGLSSFRLLSGARLVIIATAPLMNPTASPS